MYIEFIVAAALGYLLGSINSSILVGRYIYGVDIRNHGSGNAGATNTLRTLGKTAAVLVILGDLLKGVFAVLAGNEIAGSIGMLFGGFFCIVGHNWPLYFKFKGGKGILTSLAVILTIDWRIGLILAVVSVAIIALFRFVSLGSIIGSILLPIAFYYIPNIREIPKNEIVLFSIILSALAVIRHRENIVRLIKGKESKIGQKVKIK